MKSLVIYYSRGGHTREIAEVISQELSCEAIDLKEGNPDVSDVDMLLVGSGNYGGKPHQNVGEFIENLKPVKDRKAAVFSTSVGEHPEGIKIMKDGLQKKGYDVISTFDCRGQFLFLISRGHPNEKDMESAKEFAAQIRESVLDLWGPFEEDMSGPD